MCCGWLSHLSYDEKWYETAVRLSFNNLTLCPTLACTTPKVTKYTILNVLIVSSLLYNVHSMAVLLANPFANIARAISFHSFGGITAVLQGARIVLVT